jgi:hypothetical protein
MAATRAGALFLRPQGWTMGRGFLKQGWICYTPATLQPRWPGVLFIGSHAYLTQSA